MYQMIKWQLYDYTQLSSIRTLKRAGKRNKETYNDCIIMLDTETSKKKDPENHDNHVCAFTISIRADHQNLVTLYGHDPVSCIECVDKILKALPADKTIFYIHNASYDYVFLKKFLFDKFGFPEKALFTKPHYPIVIEWSCGLIIKDSLILAQKSLEKWANDLDVEHKKSVGSWDYDQIRNQNYLFSQQEQEYIEHDTLAGVECIDKMMQQLHHKIYSMPYTATGIVRHDVLKIATQNRGHDRFLKMSSDYSIYLIMEMVFHGGYTHANRYLINQVITSSEYGENIKCYDFTSSYPFCAIAYKMPCHSFAPFRDCTIDEIISHADRYAYMCRLVMTDVEIKDNSVVMPVLQASKCVKTINAIIDNGRILQAAYVEIYVSEMTLQIIKQQYHCRQHACVDVYYSRKEYLPRWFTDYIYELFKAKCTLKGKDPLNYMISKAKLNSCYGMCVQKAMNDEIIENYETGEFTVNTQKSIDDYKKYLNNRRKVLPYMWGCWITEMAMFNLFTLGSYAETWIYSDTDSVYGINFDEKKIAMYNENCKQLLRDRGYEPVIYEEKEYILGSASLDGEYEEFKTLGAKRYCCRSASDHELHITVAGVPKKGVKSLKDDINNFHKGLIFSGEVSGKKMHEYRYVDEIYTDKDGNITGDSIDLSPCDYLLDDIELFDFDSLFTEEVIVNVLSDPNE